MEIVNDPDNFKGLSLATAGPDLIIAEFDDIQPFAGDGSQTWDFEIVMLRTPSDAAGAFEIVFAYNNLNGPLDGSLSLTGGITVGVENAAADRSTALVNNADASGAITNSTIVCFDLQRVGDAVTISYQAEVTQATGAEPVLLSNDAIHITDNPGDKAAVASVTLSVSDAVFSDGFE
jgi:hypothetical protein